MSASIVYPRVYRQALSTKPVHSTSEVISWSTDADTTYTRIGKHTHVPWGGPQAR